MSLDIARLDTICALSSALGPSAIAVIRASGPKADTIFRQIFKKHRGEIKPFLAMHGAVVDGQGHLIDDVMGLLFLGSKSFTGETSFEIHCHGNHLIIEEILNALYGYGARLAEPGEFSMRALFNGKIDLAQAESIADLIHAKSSLAKDVALQGVQGGLRDKTALMQESIISVLAEIEARMDFPDEDLGSYDRSHLIDKLNQAILNLENLLASASYALKLSEGARIILCGRPNAGKSTLLNRISGEDRAIVHETAGTTRDVIEISMIVEGMAITLVDVAGIRDIADGHIESIGIAKAVAELNKAHLVLWLVDGSEADPFGDRRIQNEVSALKVPIMRVWNKADLMSSSPLEGHAISAKTGLGVDELKKAIHGALWQEGLLTQEIFITRKRQKDELEQAKARLMEAKAAMLFGMVDEVITSELRLAGLAFDRLFGTDLSEDVLDKIFSEFCIGK